MSQVRLHNSAQDCWTAISGNVYDLTPFIRQHPGGASAIISLCGIDGTAAFLNQHAGQSRPEAELQSLFIGKLR
jgi:cytochrome b involved in lipid metabolism